MAAMATIRIIEGTVPLAELKELANETYTTLIKGSVDIAQSRVAFGGDYHIESCEELTKTGSVHTDVWGFNVVFGKDNDYTVEYDSLINIKPALGNRSRIAESDSVREKMWDIIRMHIA